MSYVACPLFCSSGAMSPEATPWSTVQRLARCLLATERLTAGEVLTPPDAPQSSIAIRQSLIINSSPSQPLFRFETGRR